MAHPFTRQQIDSLGEQVQLIDGQKYKTLTEAAMAHPDTQGLISFLSDPVEKNLIDLLPDLRIIANYAVGYNNIDVDYAVSKGIWVCNTPDVLTNATADLTLALLLAASRRIVEADRYVREGRFNGWGATLLLGKELDQAVLGIVGLGRIGTAVAQRALSFGMKVVYVSPSPKTELEHHLGIKRVDFNELLEKCDIISLHLPYSPKVHHLFNRDAFFRMKPGAIFINVSRGQLMDEAALADALKAGHLFAAALDVYEQEPLVSSELLKCEQVVLAPHIGSATTQTREKMAEMVSTDVIRGLSGKVPLFLVAESR